MISDCLNKKKGRKSGPGWRGSRQGVITWYRNAVHLPGGEPASHDNQIWFQFRANRSASSKTGRHIGLFGCE